MREIKFRAWDYITKKMVNFDEGFNLENTAGFWGGDREVYNLQFIKGYGQCDGLGYFHSDFSNEVNEFELMQYTGLKDKNGKDIYEGDIVNVIDLGQEEWSHGEVVF